jgi:glycerophosphoryl diester phosphodiesterase
MIKSLLKILLFLILLLVIAYFAFAYIEGGFGKKPPLTLPLKDPEAILLFAHRGVVGKYPENSREAIEEARKLKYTGLEIDIRKSADQQFILFHDGDASRLLGQDTLINALTIDEIRQYYLLKEGDTTKSKVITLKEMLDQYNDDFIYYFDMKLGNLNDVDDLVQLIWSYDISKNVILASPSFLVVLYVEYNYPAIHTAMEGFNSGNEWVYGMIPKKLKPDFLSGTARKVDEKHIEWLKEHELLDSRIVYGVDSSNYQAMIDMGVKKMIIDYWPELLLK